MLAAYLLFPKVKETVREGIAGAIPSLEWGGIGLGEPGMPGIDLAGIISGAGTAAGEAAADAVKDAFASFFAGFTGGDDGDIDETPDTPDVPEDTTETTPSKWEQIKTEAWGIAKYGGIVGGGAIAIRYGGPPVARGIGGIFERGAGNVVRTTTRSSTAPKEIPVKPFGSKANFFKRMFGKGGGIGELSAAAFSLALPDLLAETIGLLTGKQVLHYGDPGWNVEKTWLGQSLLGMPEFSNVSLINAMIAGNQPAFGMGAPMGGWFTPAAGNGEISNLPYEADAAPAFGMGAPMASWFGPSGGGGGGVSQPKKYSIGYGISHHPAYTGGGDGMTETEYKQVAASMAGGF